MMRKPRSSKWLSLSFSASSIFNILQIPAILYLYSIFLLLQFSIYIFQFSSLNSSNYSTKMAVSITLLGLVSFLFASSATACDRCVHQSRVAFFSKAQALQSGACGYGSMAIGFNDGRLAAAAPSIYRDGAACGACFQMRCKDEKICSKKGSTIIVTDRNNDNSTGFVVSSRAFMAMAKDGMGQDILKLGLADVEYKRVPCDYKKKNLALRVEESSQKPHYLTVKLLYQGGQTEIVAMDVAQVGSSNWNYMSRNHGAVWDTSRVPNRPLQFRFVVTAGYDGKWYWAKNVLPSDWKNGAVYDSGIQITDIAQEGCSPCDDTTWEQIT